MSKAIVLKCKIFEKLDAAGWLEYALSDRCCLKNGGMGDFVIQDIPAQIRG